MIARIPVSSLRETGKFVSAQVIFANLYIFFTSSRLHTHQAPKPKNYEVLDILTTSKSPVSIFLFLSLILEEKERQIKGEGEEREVAGRER